MYENEKALRETSPLWCSHSSKTTAGKQDRHTTRLPCSSATRRWASGPTGAVHLASR